MENSKTQENKTFSFFLKLFWTMFSLSAFTLGGGYVIVPLMQKKFVDGLKWLTEEDMLNYVAIGQSAPGVIAINVSILVGFGVAGVLGAIVSVLGTVLPPFIVIVVISYFYEALKGNMIFEAVMLGFQCGVAAVILDVVYNMAKNIVKTKDKLAIFIMVSSLVLAVVFQVNVIIILISCIVIGVVKTFFGREKKV